MLKLLVYLIEIIQPILVPLCFTITWVFMILLGWTVFGATRDVVAKAKHMHQIPCTRCQYFTNDHRLKCTVRPSVANTEQAIGCIEHHPLKKPFATST